MSDRGFRRTFRSLATRNYRLFFAGHVVSQTGTWTQRVAQDWLILSLTDSGVALSVGIALQSLPLLVFGMWGGLVADRRDTRTLILWSQIAQGALAVVLGLLVITGVVQLWMVFALAFALGCVSVIDVPARQVFVMELVGPEQLANAVSLNSSVNNAARLVGPAVGGVLISVIGVAPTFFINAVSFGAVIGALLMMDVAGLKRLPPVAKSPRQLRQGLAYAWRAPEIRAPLFVLLAVSTFGQNFRIVLPLMATETFGLGAAGYGSMLSMLGLGALLGALACAHYARPTQTLLLRLAALLGVVMIIASFSPTVAVFTGLMILVGVANTSYNTTTNAVLQLRSAPELRGRVMALRTMVSRGTVPLGAPVVGWVSDVTSARVGFAAGGVIALIAATAALRTRHLDERAALTAPDLEVVDADSAPLV